MRLQLRLLPFLSVSAFPLLACSPSYDCESVGWEEGDAGCRAPAEDSSTRQHDAGSGGRDAGQERDAGSGGRDADAADIHASADGDTETRYRCPSPCSPNATCAEGESTEARTCRCNDHFMGDGETCTPIASKIAMGPTHGCAIAAEGSLWCWGSNHLGQLGLGADAPRRRTLPTRVGDAVWDEVAVGVDTTCAIREGNLYCAGDNEEGRLGFGGGADDVIPELVSLGGDDWFGLAMGGREICALRGQTGAGLLYCWGWLSAGGTATTPTPIGDSAMRWRSISTSGHHACAIRDDSSLLCWGLNFSGQVGVEEGAGEQAPVPEATSILSTLHGWDRVSTGNGSTCAIRDGELWCWGWPYDLPERVPESNVAPPRRMGSWGDWTEVALGESTGCGVRSGQLWCWGRDHRGEAGVSTGEVAPWSRPELGRVPLRRVGDATQWESLSLGDETSCGIRSGQIFCWGSNRYGRLGSLEEFPDRLARPARIGDANAWTEVSVGEGISCGVLDGVVNCWGGGSPSNAVVPTPVSQEAGWSSVQVGYASAVALKGGRVFRWRQEGDDVPFPPEPQEVTFADTYGWDRVIAVRERYTPEQWRNGYCGLHGFDGTDLSCWGKLGAYNSEDARDYAEPVQIEGSWQEVAFADTMICAISSDEALHCWNSARISEPIFVEQTLRWSEVAVSSDVFGIAKGVLYRRTGDGVERVGAADDWRDIALWWGARCGVRGKSLYCWGNNEHGQLGLDAENVAEPTLVDDGAELGWERVSLGRHHACGLRSDGSLWCWGDNHGGQAGVGPSWTHLPRAVDLPP